MLKFFERLRARILGSTSTGLVALLALGGTVAAITSPDFTYSTTKTGYLTIHPMAMVPAQDTAQYNNQYFPSTLTAVSSHCFSTGVNLPHGSRITALLVWYSSPPTSAASVIFARNNLTDGTSALLVTSVEFNDDSNTRVLANLPINGGSSLVSNTGFSYGFGFCPGVGGAFRGARIAYTYTSAGD